MSPGERDVLNWDFTAPLAAVGDDARLQGTPTITQERRTGSVDLVVDQLAVDGTGKMVSARVQVPVGSVNGQWELTATAATSSSRAYSTAFRIVQS